MVKSQARQYEGEAVFLHPGQYHVGGADCTMRTLLGSCVSIVLWQAQRQVGAMSHFLLSSREARPGAPLDGRYGEDALTLMLAQLAAIGIAPGECQAKIFGGADMFPTLVQRDARIGVGRQNGEAARQLLRDRGIPIVSESLYGHGHRRIVFCVASGAVWSTQVPPDQALAQLAKAPLAEVIPFAKRA